MRPVLLYLLVMRSGSLVFRSLGSDPNDHLTDYYFKCEGNRKRTLLTPP